MLHDFLCVEGSTQSRSGNIHVFYRTGDDSIIVGGGGKGAEVNPVPQEEQVLTSVKSQRDED